MAFAYRKALGRALAGGDHRLTPEEWSSLSEIQVNPGMTLRALAMRQDRDTTTITRMIDRLVAKGLAERRPDPKDRRAVRLFLSRKGYEAYDALRHRVADLTEQAVARLSQEQRKALEVDLKTILVALRGENNQPNG